MVELWEGLEGNIPDDVYERVMERFDMQIESAIEWRDRVNTYFKRLSGVPDELGRRIYSGGGRFKVTT
jgi:alpha-glucuronidase